LNAKLAAGVVADWEKLPNPENSVNLLPDVETDEPSGWVGAVTLKLDEKPDPNVRGLNMEVGLVSGFVGPERARGTDGEVLESVCLGGRFGVDEAGLKFFKVSYCFAPKTEKADVVVAGLESFDVSCCFVPKLEKVDAVAAGVKSFEFSYCFVPKLEKADILEAGLESFEVSCCFVPKTERAGA